MRLDHLLSKEHRGRRPQAGLSKSLHQAIVLVRFAHGVEHRLAHRQLVTSRRCDTLLGPEGSVDPSTRTSVRRTTGSRRKAARQTESSRPSLENCTVDASIKIKVFVVKLVRAFGGCLGIRSRRRTWEPAISLGELVTEL